MMEVDETAEGSSNIEQHQAAALGDPFFNVDEPLPETFARNEAGKPIPLAGVESLFLTGTTVDIMGLQEITTGTGPIELPVFKEKILGDIQFRGAISDFHTLKAKIQAADYDPIVIRYNADDTYGDGNNFEIALSKSAAELWEMIHHDVAWRMMAAELAEARQTTDKVGPNSKRRRDPQPWVSHGSEIEVAELPINEERELVQWTVQRKRRELNQVYKMMDKDAHEMWNSSQMECRPYKDPHFELRRMEQDTSVQAVAALRDAAVQATPGRPRPNCSQYTPRDLPQEAKDECLQSEGLIDALDRASAWCEEALIQNEVTDIFRNDLAALGAEDGMSGSRQENVVSEYQSFTHLLYSKSKVITSIQWLPHRRGFVAVACAEALSHAERVSRCSRPNHSYILIWNFKDPIHPEYVLESPAEVYSFQYNPINADIITAGCFNGQVVMWDLSFEHDRIARQKNQRRDEGSDEATIPIVKHKFMTALELSHYSVVNDLQWLPGVDISRDGKVQRIGDGAMQECHFFATAANDGRVMFWDIRVERLMKKGRKLDDIDLCWRPTHCVHLISLQGMDLACMRFTFNPAKISTGDFYIGSFDGEITHAEFIKPDGDDNPDYTKFCVHSHAGPVVALKQSPIFPNVLLSVGDWSFQIWIEGKDVPIFLSPYADEYYTAGCWSPTRPAVIYLADVSGNLHIWDLLDRSHEPSLKVTVSSSAIMSLGFNPSLQAGGSTQQLLAVGDSVGVLHIMELPRNLRRPVSNEKKLMAQFLEREEARVLDVSSREGPRKQVKRELEEAKKAAEDAELATRDASMTGASCRTRAAMERELDERNELEYRKLEHEFKVQLGLIETEA